LGETRLPAGYRRAAIAICAAFAVAALCAPGPARAHASLVKSAPAQRSILYRSPATIQLWFNERLEPRYSSLSLLDPSGKPVETGAPEVGPDDPRRLSATVKELAPGRYTVKYRVLSTDGHVVESQFPFTIRK
jgi:methionine-rich copper-binding protein CopC